MEEAKESLFVLLLWIISFSISFGSIGIELNLFNISIVTGIDAVIVITRVILRSRK